LAEPVLRTRALQAGYGAGRMIVHGVDIEVHAGEIITIIGQNGAGKSTLLKGIFNMLPLREGEVVLEGATVTQLAPHALLSAGLAYVPQHHSVFPRLTVAENIRMGGFLLRDKALLAQRTEAVEAMFPILAERRRHYAASLSGGEQRMLEIARTLVMDPRVIMLDEPSIGLAPRMIDLVFETARKLAGLGKAVLMVEQNVRKALLASDRGYVLELGQVKLTDQAARLVDDDRVARLYMGRRAEPA
jgi:branched-chain amino acid transport system ATP-binding protein